MAGSQGWRELSQHRPHSKQDIQRKVTGWVLNFDSGYIDGEVLIVHETFLYCRHFG